MPLTRREALRLLAAPAGIAALGIPALGLTPPPSARSREKLKVLVAGGHPDDPESGCGGTIARYVGAGHDVVVLYLTRGEAGIDGTPHDEAARIRSAESQRACTILGARPLFFGQVDGDTHIDGAAYTAMRELLERERPDALFTHWPIDTHPDHRAASLLVYDAWMRTGRKIPLGYFEVLTGEQTEVFRPTDYVDISTVAERKRDATFAHASQKPAEWYPVHERMAVFRGMEHGCAAAEAFVRHDAGPALLLP